MKIVIVDDDNIVAMSLKTIIEATGNISVAALGNSGSEAVALYEQYKPDVLLMDIRMDGMTGLEAGEIILRNDSDAKILYLTTFSDDEYIVKALKTGAKGYILKQDFQGNHKDMVALPQLWRNIAAGIDQNGNFFAVQHRTTLSKKMWYRELHFIIHDKILSLRGRKVKRTDR